MSVGVHHRLEGPDGAAVVMFSNSLGTTLEMWDDQAVAVGDRYRVLRFDTRGHGRSPVPPGPYTVDDLADDALALLDHLGIERVAFCGLSLGGAIGMTLALRAPERLERLILCSTALEFGPPEGWLDRAAIARTEGMDAIAPAGIERWFTPDVPAAVREKFDAMLRSADPEGYASCCEAVAALDLRGRLAGVRLPALTIAATGDPVTPPEKLAAIAAEIPGTRSVVVDAARHIVNAEQPARVTAALIEFLDAG